MDRVRQDATAVTLDLLLQAVKIPLVDLDPLQACLVNRLLAKLLADLSFVTIKQPDESLHLISTLAFARLVHSRASPLWGQLEFLGTRRETELRCLHRRPAVSLVVVAGSRMACFRELNSAGQPVVLLNLVIGLRARLSMERDFSEASFRSRACVRRKLLQSREQVVIRDGGPILLLEEALGLESEVRHLVGNIKEVVSFWLDEHSAVRELRLEFFAHLEGELVLKRIRA